MGFARINKRIGTIDFGTVLDRDRSLTNITKDSRLQNKPSPNPNSVLGRFMAKVNSAEGFSRPNRFYINLVLPRAMQFALPYETDESEGFRNSQYDMTDTVRDVQAFCSTITIPDRTMTQKPIRFGSAPARKFVTDVSYADITATFYCDKLMLERNFFELWQQAAYNTSSHNFEYYDNYVGAIEIFQLGSFKDSNNADDLCHAVRLMDCYPTSVGTVELGFDKNNQIGTITVSFSYRNWTNYAIDHKGDILGRGGRPSQNAVEIVDRASTGFLDDIQRKLPPVLRRPLRNASQQLVRGFRNPLTAILGGQIAPPFANPEKRIAGLF